MRQFEIGKRYFMRSACDHDCIWSYDVIARTAKTVTLQQISQHPQEPIRRRISVFEGCERVMPEGQYSMAPVLTADREILPSAEEEAKPSVGGGGKVLDFTSRLEAVRKQKEADTLIDRFKNEYLPFLTDEDRELFLAAPSDEGRMFALMLICSRIDMVRGRASSRPQ